MHACMILFDVWQISFIAECQRNWGIHGLYVSFWHNLEVENKSDMEYFQK